MLPLQDIHTFVQTFDSATGTSNTYEQKLRVFHAFCFVHRLPFFPTTVPALTSFLHCLLTNQRKAGTIDGYVSAVSKMYRYYPHINNPCKHPLVRGMQKVARRLCPPPARKLPVLPSILVTLAKRVNVSSFIDVRDHFAFTLMMKAFLRPDSAARLLATDVWFEWLDNQEVLFVFCEKMKNDQLRHGHIVLLGTGKNPLTCPLLWAKLYCGLRDGQCTPLFHKANNAPNRRTAHLHPSTFNSLLKKRLTAADIEGHYTAQGLRAGGVSTALAQNVALRLAKRHGNWRSDAVFRYITDSVADQLSVSTCF
jgi:integrase